MSDEPGAGTISVSPGDPVEAPQLEGWIRQHGPELRRHLIGMLGSGAEADDVLQETWLTAHREPPRTGEGSNVRAWLYRVATNEALDVLARRRRRESALRRRAPETAGDPPEPPDEILDVLGPKAMRRVRDEVSRLPRKQRDAVWLRWLDGEPYSDIAARLGTSEASARANVYQGMKRLRERLRDVWNEEVSA